MIMQTYLGYALLATIAGGLIPVIAGINASFSQAIGSTAFAALVLFGVGFVAVLVVISVSNIPIPQNFDQLKLYHYAGGFIVAFYILTITFLVPRFGVGNSILFVIVAQIISAVLIDHFGFFGSEIRLFDLNRGIGIVLLIAGTYITRL